MTQKQPVGMAVAKFDYKASDLHELNIIKGEKLTLLDDSQHWWQVMNSSGETGYVPSNFCKKSKQGLFSSLKNTLGRKKNKESTHPSSCGASSVGTAPSCGGGRRSVTSSPKNINSSHMSSLAAVSSAEAMINENSLTRNDHHIRHKSSFDGNNLVGVSGIGHLSSVNPFTSMASLKSNGSTGKNNSSNNIKLLSQKLPQQSMSFNVRPNISLPTDVDSNKVSQIQPVISSQLLQYSSQKMSNTGESQFHSSMSSHVFSTNQQFNNGREYFGSGIDSKSKISSANDNFVDSSADQRFRQDPRMSSSDTGCGGSGGGGLGDGGLLFSSAISSVESISVCVAKFSYSPCQPDELALSRGDRIKVLEKSSDGWWRGELISNASILSTGWFPSNYVTLERPQHSNTSSSGNNIFRSTKDNIGGRQPQYPVMPVNIQVHSSMPSVTSGMESTCVINNHHGEGIDKWSGSNKLYALQRFSTVLTLYPFLKNQPEEMSFEANEILEVLDRPIDDPDWWRCRNVNGDIGLVPRNYVKQLTATGAVMSKQSQSTVNDQKQCLSNNSDNNGDSIRMSCNHSGRFKDRIWYWGSISRIECESLLMTNGYLGQFVVRDSESHPGDLTITMHAGTKCRNFKIHIQNNDYYIGQKVFSSVETLIQHYRTHPIYKSDSERLFLTDSFQYKTPLSSF